MKNTTKRLSTVFSLLFIVLIVVLSFHARFAADDYYFIYLKSKFGVLGGTLYQYNDFSGRWLSHFFTLLLLTFSNFKYFLPLFFIFTFGAFYLVLSSLFYKFYIKYDIDESKFSSEFPPLLFLATFFLCSFSIGENFFWFISVTTYMWSILFSLILVNLYLNKKKRLYTPILLIVASLYIGGASESYALLMLMFSALFIIFKIRDEGIEQFKSDPDNRQFLFSIILIFVSFLISTLSPGTCNRNELLPSTTLIQKGSVLLKSVAKIIIQYLPTRLPVFILLSLPWLAFGYFIQKSLALTTKEIWKRSFYVLMISLTAIVISLTPTAFMLGEMGPARALSVITLIFTITSAVLFTYIGMAIKRESVINKISIAAISISAIGMIYVNIRVYSTDRLFTSAYDQRMEKILELNKAGFSGIAEFQPLPPTAMLYHAEFSEDTTYFVNQHWKKGLDLKYNVVISH